MAYKVTKGGIGYTFVSVAMLFGSLGTFLSIAELEVWMVCAYGLRKKKSTLVWILNTQSNNVKAMCLLVSNQDSFLYRFRN